MKLSPCQEKSFVALTKNSDNIFLTGSAGSGKSFLIRHFLKERDWKLFPIVASTGVAAILVGGRTFHSFFGLGIMEGGVEKTIERALEDRRVVKRLKKIEGFVLDEVSMISGPTLRAAEEICRKARKKDLPWGGARVVAVGDFAQLPPVNPLGHQKEWAFLDMAWSRSGFNPVVLKTVMRSDDPDYIRMLNFIREGVVNEEVAAYLNAKTDPDFSDPETPHLFPHRDTAEQFNLQRLAEIKNPLVKFKTAYSGTPQAIEKLKKQAPIPEILQLKKLALVMIRVNDPFLKYVNGSLGTIVKIRDGFLDVRLRNGAEVKIEKTDFSILSADGYAVATASNFPVNLAYATTIHKSQGATMDGVVCDLRGLWEPGQAYVALSRLKRGNGLRLKGWDKSSIRVDPQVVEFHRTLNHSR